MGCFSVKLLLIASLSWWVSGAAAFAHERMEADEAGAGAAPAPTPNSAPDVAPLPTHKHSPDDCPICQLLATMRAEGGVALGPPSVVQLLQCGVLTLTPQDVPSLFQFAPIHSRGPPHLEF